MNIFAWNSFIFPSWPFCLPNESPGWEVFSLCVLRSILPKGAINYYSITVLLSKWSLWSVQEKCPALMRPLTCTHVSPQTRFSHYCHGALAAAASGLPHHHLGQRFGENRGVGLIEVCKHAGACLFGQDHQPLCTSHLESCLPARELKGGLDSYQHECCLLHSVWFISNFKFIMAHS